MIQIKYLLFSILFCSTLTLSATDINSSVEIIEEASKATEELQKDFSKLIEEKEPIQNETISNIKDNNITAQEVIVIEDNQTIQKRVIVQNKDNKEHQIVVTEESNKTLQNITEKEDGSFIVGMAIFKTKLKVVCKMTGEDFAKNYTQEDWDDIYDNNEFEKTVYKLCPEIKGKYDEKWTNDLYQFSLKYASDSDEIPEC